MSVLDLLRRCEAAGFYIVADGRLKAPRSVDAALVAEARERRELVAAGLVAWAECDALNDELGVREVALRQWSRLMALESLLDGDEAAALRAEADAIVALPAAALESPLVGEALRLGATVEGWEAKL